MKISYTYILFSLFLAFLPGCELIHDDLPETRTDGEPVYIRLQISTGGEMSATRSNPTGGEDGDGREPGTDNENKITDVTLFLYDASVSINDDDAASTPIDKVITFNQFDNAGNELPLIEKRYTSETKEVSGLSKESYKVLAVANCDLSSETFTTLGDVLDYTMTGALWTGSGSATTSFVMSSEEEASIPNVLNSPDIQASTKQYPAEVEITIERLAAKVDYKVAKASFETTDKTGTVKILGAELVNDFKKGTLLFKRVGAFVDASTFTYLGDEDPASGDATNWVVDAYDTSNKNKTDYNNYYPSFNPSAITNDANNTEWVHLGYTMENTNNVSGDDLEKYATGVVFKAQYTPKGDEYEEGKTFYSYNSTIYPSIQAIIDANPETAGMTETTCEQFGVNVFENGICYYTWWIRHSNNANDDIMRYGIVRNNWYQLTVNSIKGLPSGDDDIVIIVAVEKWQPLESKDLTLKK